MCRIAHRRHYPSLRSGARPMKRIRPRLYLPDHRCFDRLDDRILQWVYSTVRPPSTMRFCPVMYELASEHRKRIAPSYSSSRAIRFMGMSS
jgi:hypothetical protein